MSLTITFTASECELFFLYVKIFSGLVKVETCVKKRIIYDSPSSPLHLFMYEKETYHNSADNSAFDVFIWLTKCAHNAPKAMYNFKNVQREGKDKGRGRGEGHKCNHHWNWGA